MPEVQSPPQFATSFLAEAKKAKNRIYLQSLLFEAGDFLNQCEPIFIEKARTGVPVEVTLDSISTQYVGDNVNFVIEKVDAQKAKRVHQETRALIARWTAAGIKITFTNRPKLITKLIPIYRRNHIKIYVVDDITWLGGVNACDESLTFIDFMVRFTDPILVRGVTKQFYLVDTKKPKQDYSIASPPQEVLVDAGLLGRSRIFDTATQMITEAKERVVFASQFIPDGKLFSEILRASQKGVHITVITSPKEIFMHFPYSIPYKTFLAKTRDNPNIKLFHQKKKVHAKLLIVDNTTALFGSHNLVFLGVILGTEEIAVKTKDKQLIKDLAKFVDENTAGD